MRDQEQGMEKVSGGGGGGGGRRKGGLSIPMTGGCGVGVAILVFAAAATAVGASVVARARRARREDQTTKRSFAEDADKGVKEEVEVEENGSIISQRREEMGEETEEISFQIDEENQSIGKREDTEIVAVAATEEEEEVIIKASNDGDYDHESSEESKAIPTEVKVFEEVNDEKEGDKKEEEEDSTEDEKAARDPSPSVEFEATTEPSTEEAVDGSNDDSRACLSESRAFEAAAEAIENTSETEENDFSAKKREVEWKLEDDVKKDPRGEPQKIEIRNTGKTIAIEENEIGFAIANRSKGGLVMISAFVLAIVLLLLVRRDRPGVLDLSTT